MQNIDFKYGTVIKSDLIERKRENGYINMERDSAMNGENRNAYFKNYDVDMLQYHFLCRRLLIYMSQKYVLQVYDSGEEHCENRRLF